MKKHDTLVCKIAQSSQKKPRHGNPVSSRYCEHCHQNLSLKVFKKHERLYKKSDQTWTTMSDDDDGDDHSAGNYIVASLPAGSSI